MALLKWVDIAIRHAQSRNLNLTTPYLGKQKIVLHVCFASNNDKTLETIVEQMYLLFLQMVQFFMKVKKTNISGEFLLTSVPKYIAC